MKALEVRWPTASPKSLFVERKERSLRTDTHLTPSQKFGVVSQQDYMGLSGGRVVLNLAGSDKMKHVEPGDFIIHLRSFQGGLERSSLKGKVSPAYTVLQPRADLSDRFYQWVFWSDWYIGELASTVDQLRDGQSINYRTFIRTTVPIPPTPEQEIIADFLDRETARLDALVEAQTELIATMKERRSVLIGETLRHAEASVGGGATRLKHLLVRPGSGTIPIKGEVSTEPGPDLFPAFSASGQDVWVPEPQHEGPGLVLSAVGARCGKVFEADGQWGVVANTGVFYPTALLDVHYGWYLLNREDFWEKGGSAQPYVRVGETLKRKIGLPPIGQQRRIADFLDAETAKIDALIGKAEEFIEVAKERRSALITAAVTGQIDVKEMVA